MNNTMIFYHCSPIDLKWHLVPRVEDVLRNVVPCSIDWKQQWSMMFYDDAYDGFFETLVRSLDFARDNGWEGDFVYTPRVIFFPYPGNETFLYGFAWKQSNNGSSFVVSPLELPWLYENAFIDRKEFSLAD